MSMMSLPLGWKSAKLCDIAKMVMGQSPPSDTYNENRIGLPFLQGKADFTESFPRPTKWCTMPLKIAPKGSVLISVRAPVGDVNLADQEYIIGRGLSSISIDNGDNGFLFYSLIHNKNRINAQGSGTTFQSINKSTLESFSILLPPLPEQRAIARALRAVQRAREARLREVALERERKAALMEHLFTKGSRGEATKMTDIGEMPESWNNVNLGDVCTFTTGKLNSEMAVDNGRYPFFTCSRETFKIDSYSFDQEAILLAGNNAQGIYSVKYYKGKFDAYQRTYIISVRSTELMNYHYLLYDLSRKLDFLRKQSLGATTRFLTATIIKNLKMSLPSISEQRIIADVLQCCDSKIAALEQEARLLEELFRAMLEELMSGRLPARALVEEAA